MQRTRAPFRADEVGSLLRPQKIKEARAKLEKGEISADELRKIEDTEIEKVVHRQASVGLKLLRTRDLTDPSRIGLHPEWRPDSLPRERSERERSRRMLAARRNREA